MKTKQPHFEIRLQGHLDTRWASLFDSMTITQTEDGGTVLTGPEIARELMVSLNTMRTHTKNIYSKLGANSRRTAVRRAEELNLL